MTTFANVAIERDEFASDEFIDKTAALPTVIVLNAQHNYGYFIPLALWRSAAGLTLMSLN
jgi:hypothetical protein